MELISWNHVQLAKLNHESQSMPSNFTLAARVFVGKKRHGKDVNEPPDWFAVAAAYDAGMYHGLNARDSAKREFERLRAAADVGGEHG